MKAFIGTYSDDILYIDGDDIFVAGKCANPSYLTFYDDKLIAVAELDNFEDLPTGTVNLFERDGYKLSQTACNLSFGKHPCHLDTVDDKCFVANYTSGTVSVYDIKNNLKLIKTIDHNKEFEGKTYEVDEKFYEFLDKDKCKINPNRQEGAHAHSTVVTPDKKYVATCDLGLDMVIFYDLEVKVHSVFKLPKGQGPRHIVFNQDKAYIVTELASTVIICAYKDGTLQFEHLTYSVDEGDRAKNSPAAIRLSPCKNYIAVSNRFHDSISMFDIKNNMSLVQNILSRGGNPRDIEFSPDGKYLVAANKNDKTLVFFSFSAGKLDFSHEIKLEQDPVMILFDNRD